MTPPETLRASIEKLAPTGEGLVRTREGVGLVSGALPGEDVDVEVVRVTRKIWRGRVAGVHAASPSRVTGGHADGCPACDWAHFDPGAAREAKRSLFLETMSRIGRIPEDRFGSLPIAQSPPGYRLRSRFHAERRDGRFALGAFAPGTHRVESLTGCLALTDATRSLLAPLAEVLDEAGVSAGEIATVESLDGTRRIARISAGPCTPAALAAALSPLFDGVRVREASGRIAAATGEPRLWLSPAGRELPATPDAFFQANRFLIGSLAGHVRDAAAAIPPGEALDAFGGVGLFAGALLDAGHRVISVESHAEAALEAGLAREKWAVGKRWRIERADTRMFAGSDRGREAVVVVDPPRGGLGIALARSLGNRAARRFIYVSCDPPTLARDLAVLLSSGWAVSDARLFDLFAFTHRVEAVVVLDRS